MEERRLIYTFEAPEPAESPPVGRFMLILFLGMGAIAIVVIVISHLGSNAPVAPTQSVVSNRKPERPPAYVRIVAYVPCPGGFLSGKGGGFEYCAAISLPEWGGWARRSNTNHDAWEISLIPNVQARGCNGEIYSLAISGQRFNEAYGYLDYRVADGRARTIIEGHKPLAPQQEAAPQQQPENATLVGSRSIPCPPEYQSHKGGFGNCVAIDLPGSGGLE